MEEIFMYDKYRQPLTLLFIIPRVILSSIPNWKFDACNIAKEYLLKIILNTRAIVHLSNYFNKYFKKYQCVL